MKNLENLGRNLSKMEQRNIRGGYVDPGDGGTCKSSTTSCSYVQIDGHVDTGTCGDTITPPLQTTQCACKFGTNKQPANECNNSNS
jgi:hypothetical protein